MIKPVPGRTYWYNAPGHGVHKSQAVIFYSRHSDSFGLVYPVATGPSARFLVLLAALSAFDPAIHTFDLPAAA